MLWLEGDGYKVTWRTTHHRLRIHLAALRTRELLASRHLLNVAHRLAIWTDVLHDVALLWLAVGRLCRRIHWRHMRHHV